MDKYIDNNSPEPKILKKVIGLCELFDFPTAIFNADLECIYSRNNIIKLKSKVNLYTTSDDIYKAEDFITTIFIIRGVQYCAKILKTDNMYICGLFDNFKVGEMAGNTDFFERIAPSFHFIKYSLSHLWEIMTTLKSLEQNKIASEMESYLLDINQRFQNVFSLLQVILFKPKPMRVNCSELLNNMIRRCNALLCNCGRYIDFMGEYTECYVCADQRHIIYAFINAIQNSLLYSPKDCNPFITLSNSDIDGKKYVILKIVNESSYFLNNHDNIYENNISKNRIGCGIPLIKLLMEETGGEFTINENDGRVTAILKMPALEPLKSDVMFFECTDSVNSVNVELDEMIDFMMYEVVQTFNCENEALKNFKNYSETIWS